MTDSERSAASSSPDEQRGQPLVPPPPAVPRYAPTSLPPRARPSAPYGTAPYGTAPQAPAPHGTAPHAPAPHGYPAPAPLRGGRNVFGLTSLIAAIVGTVLALIPGVFVIGWVVLPVAFVLAIISLFRRGSKRTGIAGIVVSVVGTILGLVVALVTFAFLITESYERAVDEAGERPESGMVQPGDIVGDPLPLGMEIRRGDWSVTVDDVTFSATEAVLAESEINERPEEGKQYILVHLSTTYLGQPEGYPAEVQLQYLASDGTGTGAYEPVTLAPDRLDIGGKLERNGRASGNVAFLVPSEGARNAVLSVTPGIGADEVFVALE